MRAAGRVSADEPRAPLAIDGSHGEGGGQILRTALALSAATGRPVRLFNIRAGRAKPGLAAQHLTAIRAAAALCGANVVGDALSSQALTFTPCRPVEAGTYRFDVADARVGGSAGSATLVLQTVLVPLALADGRSELTIVGGTHLDNSPCFDYAREVWMSALAAMGFAANLDLLRWGWFPIGEGEISATISGTSRRPRPYVADERGALRRVYGRAVASNLPVHIPNRMAEHARTILREAGLGAEIDVEIAGASCSGTGIFLTAEYERVRAGFSALGARGKPAERVAEEAVAALLDHHRSGAALDAHLADQLVLPAAIADGPSRFSVARLTRHLQTNAWVVARFGLATVEILGREGERGAVTINPACHRVVRAPSPDPAPRSGASAD